MRCNCCNEEIAAGWAICAHCGFPVIGSAEGSQQEIDNVRKMASEYRCEKLKGVKVGIAFYEYEEKNGVFYASTKEDVIICDLGDLQATKVTWLEDEFAAVEKTQTVELEAFAQYPDGTKERFVISTLVEGSEKANKVAVSWAEGFAVNLIVGNESAYNAVGTFPIGIPN